MFDLGVTTETKVSNSKLLVNKYLTGQQGDFGGSFITSPLSSTSAGSNLSCHHPNFNKVKASTGVSESIFQEDNGTVLADLNSSDKRKRNNGSKGRKPGRPPSLFVNVSDSELTEEERKLKLKILKRRQRQNRSYQRKKFERNMLKQGSSLSKVVEATSTEQVTNSVSCCLFASSSSSMECGQSLYEAENKCSSSYLEEELEVFPSNGFSYTSSLEENSFDDPLQQLLKQDVESVSESCCARQDISQTMWSTCRLCTDSCSSCVLDNKSVTEISSLIACTWNQFQSVFNSLSVSAQEAWKAFSIFSDSFECAAAFHVLGWSENERSILLNTIDSLEQANVLLVDSSGGRLRLYPLAKCFIMEYLLGMSGYHQQKFEIFKYRYLSYYSQWIRQNVNDTMFLKLGSCKEEALRLYSLERANIEQAIQFAKELGWKTYRWFIVATGCLLRYIWDVSTRKEEYCNLLERKEDTQIKPKLLSESPVGVEQLYLEEENNLDNLLGTSLLECPPCMEESILLRMIGEVYFENKDWNNAHAYVTSCLHQMSQMEVSSQQQWKHNEIICFYLLACIEKENGQWNVALSLAERARDECVRMQMEFTAVWVQINLVITSIYIKLGRVEEAHATVMNVSECVQSIGILYDFSLLLELDALLGTVLRLKGNGSSARYILESIRKLPKYFYEWGGKGNVCDYLLDYSVWSCLESLTLWNSDTVYHHHRPNTLVVKQDIVDSCSYLFDSETSLAAIQEEYDWGKGSN